MSPVRGREEEGGMKREEGERGREEEEGEKGEKSVVTVFVCLMQGLSGNHVISLHDNNKG